jgi:hypothetical protein
MSQRSVLHCALGALITLLLLATPAGAAIVPVPAEAPTVATTPSGAALIAWVAGGKLCVALQRAGAARPVMMHTTSISGERAPGECVPPLALPQFDALPLGYDPPGGSRFTAWGLAGPSVARVEVRVGSAIVAASAARPAALPGPAADLRFWALDVGDVRPVDEVALLDDAGVMRRALDPRESLLSFQPSDSTQHVTTLREGRRGRSTWRLRRTVRTVLAPTPLEPERREQQSCLTFTTGTEDPIWARILEGDGQCDRWGLRRSPLNVSAGSACRIGAYLTVLTRQPVRSVYAVLGDGTRRTVGLRPFGGFYPSGRAGALVIGDNVAIREVVALGAHSRPVAREEVRKAPVPPSSCEDDSGSGGLEEEDDDSGLLDTVERLDGRQHALRAVDRGAQLCVSVDRAPRFPEDCALPPVDPQSLPVGVFVGAGGRKYLAAIAPAEISQARVTFDDRSTRMVPATPIAGYAGTYATAVRQVAVDVPAGRDAARIELLDTRGRTIGIAKVPEELGLRFGRSVTLAPPSRGIGPLRATSLAFDGEAATCVATLRVTNEDECTVFVYPGEGGSPSVSLVARCAPRRIVVVAVLPHRDDRLVLGLHGGREVVARRVRIPARAGGGAGRMAAFAVLGPDARLDTISVRGRVTDSISVRLPPVAAQCGYERNLNVGADGIDDA